MRSNQIFMYLTISKLSDQQFEFETLCNWKSKFQNGAEIVAVLFNFIIRADSQFSQGLECFLAIQLYSF
jgi:hypothetical protein